MNDTSPVPVTLRAPCCRAEELLTEAFLALHSGFTSIETFRVPALAGLETGLEPLAARHRSILEALAAVIPPPPSAEPLEALLARTFYPAKRASAVQAIDAASLVFAHAVFEGAIHTLLDVAALVRRRALLERLAERRVPVRCLLDASLAATTLDTMLDSYTRELKRLSLRRKVDLLLHLFRCRSTFDVVAEPISVDRIEAIDRQRQAVLHQDPFQAPLPQTDSAISYLSAAGQFYLAVVAVSSGLEVSMSMAIHSVRQGAP